MSEQDTTTASTTPETTTPAQETKAPAKSRTTRAKAPAKTTGKGKVDSTKTPTQVRAARKTTTKETKAPAKETKAPAKVTKAPAKSRTTKTGPQHPGSAWLALLEEKDLSQTKVANQMGVAPMSVNRVVRGEVVPTAKFTVAFAKATGEDVEGLWAAVCAYTLALALQDQ